MALYAALVAMTLTGMSCGVYTFSASNLGDIKTIAVPVFENQTTESDLGNAMSDQLSKAFVADNTVRVVTAQKADGILRGTVVSYVREAYTYSQTEVVSEYICRLGVDIEFRNRKTNKIIWEEKNLSNWGTYNSATETENDGKQKAVEKLVADILNKTVKGW